jgi:hypothetical protein
MRENAIEVALAACLLNIMFLTKISGFLLGVMILLAGCLLKGRTVHRLLSLCVTLLIFAAITAIEFKATGLEFLPIIQDYELAAHARLSYSLNDIVRAMARWPLVASVALLVLFAVSQRLRELRVEFRCIILIIGTYTACQLALNMTNDGDPSMWLAPAAMASLAVCLGAKPAAQQGGGSESWWQRFALHAKIFARQAIPFVIFALVLVPQIMSSINGVTVGALVSLGIQTPYVVTAGKGISFRSYADRDSGPAAYDRTLPDAVAAISSLNLGGEAIANLDTANPFPVLFLAPPPKGIQVFWTFGYNVPWDALLEWQDVIGDACVVTIPVQPWIEDNSVRLADIVRPKLATDFKLVYQDALWSIYRRARDCARAEKAAVTRKVAQTAPVEAAPSGQAYVEQARPSVRFAVGGQTAENELVFSTVPTDLGPGGVYRLTLSFDANVCLDNGISPIVLNVLYHRDASIVKIEAVEPSSQAGCENGSLQFEFQNQGFGLSELNLYARTVLSLPHAPVMKYLERMD